MPALDYAIYGEIERLTQECKIERPRAKRDRYGQFKRDPRAEFDWYYQLPELERAYISKNYMSADGVPIDVLATNTHSASVDAYAVELVRAIHAARNLKMNSLDPLSDAWMDAASQLEEDDELLGPDEFAELMNVKRNTLAQWKRRGILPKPERTISKMPLWRRIDIVEFGIETGRQPINPE